MYEIYHYGVETSQSAADVQCTLFTVEEWQALRVESLIMLKKATSKEEARALLADDKNFIGDLARYDTPLFQEFNRRTHAFLVQNLRSNTTDIICLPLPRFCYETALTGLNYATVEVGIGCSGASADYRVYESYSWLAHNVKDSNANLHNYHFVVPHFFNSQEFPLQGETPKQRVGFLGRLCDKKGCHIILHVAERFPEVEFVLCGQGTDYGIYLKQPNIKYLPPIHGQARAEFLGSLVALMAPTTYLEPFGCSVVEAQLCATPVICSDFGGPAETVKQGKTGLRCHTLADYCYGVQCALQGKFDRVRIHERAVKYYDLQNVAPGYHHVFQSILNMYRPEKRGWFAPDCHLVPWLEKNQ